ncbi:thiamine pyrophosphate-dependent dehydrogenase E1 component subunit alpha [Melissospora conviva]|uniref:thiamine pyrophosphate-dependent dehydrogenase E1 component subunit alpha n=1 Tax=Melissospora conviva TaxID=3388432 RepID=UPI003B7D2F85
MVDLDVDARGASSSTGPARQLSRLADADLGMMLLIREFELAVLRLFDQGEVSGTTHTCLGQEYIPVALAPLLDEHDHVLSNHRGHGHYLARFDDPTGLLAEITGRVGAICHGVGGSQHILREGYLSTGVQGASMPVAVGVALRQKRLRDGRMTVVYVGDGTWGEGTVYEALNMASLWRLPLLVVVEHNGIAQSTITDRQLAGTIAGRVTGFDVDHHLVTSMDVERIRAELAPVIERVRVDHRPAVVEFRTVRVGPHSKGDDTRPAEVIQEAERNEWLTRYTSAYPEQVRMVRERERLRMAALVSDVIARPLSTWPDMPTSGEGGAR